MSGKLKDNSGSAEEQQQSASEMKNELKALDKRRQQLTLEYAEAVRFLDTTPVGLHGALVDSEGFPRDDCDLFAVRKARHTIACHTNDLRALEDEMAALLGALHAATADEAKAQMASTSSSAQNGDDANGGDEQRRRVQQRTEEVRAMTQQQAETNRRLAAVRSAPRFALVSAVQPSGPAANAGLQVGDEVISFGRLGAGAGGGAATNGAEKVRLEDVGALTRDSEGQVVTVVVRRRITGGPGAAAAQVHELPLVPQRGWGGNGLLGCTLAMD